MGLNSAELAIFNLLKEDSIKAGIEDEREMVKFTYEILEAIEPYVTLIDWQHKSDILRQIRKASKLVFHQKDIDKKASRIFEIFIMSLKEVKDRLRKDGKKVYEWAKEDINKFNKLMGKDILKFKE